MKVALLTLLPLLVAASPVARDDGKRLAVFAENEEPVLLTEAQLYEEKGKGRNYFDVTNNKEDRKAWRGWKAAGGKKANEQQYPAPGKYKGQVEELAAKLDEGRARDFLTQFSAYETRYYKSQTGSESQKWLLDQVNKISEGVPHNRKEVSVRSVSHPWGQDSIIAVLPGNKNKPRVILGAHLDSVAGRDPYSRSPGADDDGSGTTTLLEAFRVLVESGIKFKNQVEFHWYAGEEAGLLGSQVVAEEYKRQGVDVKAYLNCDMTGYFPPGDEHIGIVRDNVNKNLADFVAASVGTYLGIPARDTNCGYACSDHASWNTSGYPAAFGFETEFGKHSPAIHTSKDTIDQPGFSFKHLLNFSKLAIAFALELAA